MVVRWCGVSFTDGSERSEDAALKGAALRLNLRNGKGKERLMAWRVKVWGEAASER